MYVNAKEKIKHSSVCVSLVYIFMQTLLLIYLMLCFLFYLYNKNMRTGRSLITYLLRNSFPCSRHLPQLPGLNIPSKRGAEGSSLRRAAPSVFQVLEAYMPCWPVYCSLQPLCCLVGLYFTEIFGATGILKFIFIKYLYAENKYMSFQTHLPIYHGLHLLKVFVWYVQLSRN